MISKFFIEHPVLANVLAIIIVLIGAVAVYTLPVSEYPNVVPPTVQVSTRYPGASPQTVIDTVALPIEMQVNGVDRMLYMQSTSAADGTYNLTVTFDIGTDPNIDQVLVQNRVNSAMASLPESVQAQGVTIEKKNTAILQIVTLDSPDGRIERDDPAGSIFFADFPAADPCAVDADADETSMFRLPMPDQIARCQNRRRWSTACTACGQTYYYRWLGNDDRSPCRLARVGIRTVFGYSGHG